MRTQEAIDRLKAMRKRLKLVKRDREALDHAISDMESWLVSDGAVAVEEGRAG